MKIPVFKKWIDDTITAGKKEGLSDEDIGLVLLEMAFSIFLWIEVKKRSN